MTDIDQRLAIEGVRQLRSAYSAHLDGHEVDKLADLFAEDAVCSFASFGDWTGRETIRTNYTAVMKEIGEPFDSIHAVTNDVITLDGLDAAHGVWCLTDILTRQAPITGMATRGGHDRPLLYLGVYEDRCRIIDGKWRFERVDLHFLWPERSYRPIAWPGRGAA